MKCDTETSKYNMFLIGGFLDNFNGNLSIHNY